MTLDLPTHGSTSKILEFRLSTEGFILQTTSVGVLGCGVVSAMLGKDTISSRKSGSLWVSFGGVVVSSVSVDEVFVKASAPVNRRGKRLLRSCMSSAHSIGSSLDSSFVQLLVTTFGCLCI